MENVQTTPAQATEQTTQVNAPSLHSAVCPHCKKNDFVVLGTKGAKGAAVGIGMAFGAIGNLVADSMNKDDVAIKPLRCQCNACRKKFEILPLKATPEEILETPCTVNFTRLSSFVGMAVSQQVWLNGVKVGAVGNGKSLSFPVHTRYNTLFVTDQYGVAFKGNYKFEAVSGGTIDVRFKKKFLQ